MPISPCAAYARIVESELGMGSDTVQVSRLDPKTPTPAPASLTASADAAYGD